MTRIGSRTTGRPTLAEVARLSGVSPITASRALRGVSTVAPELVEKVQVAAATLGYVANPAARALASAQSQSVVVLIPSLSNHLFIDTLEAIHEVMRPRGLEVLIGNYHYDLAEEENLIRNYLAYQPCGILLTGFDRTEAAQRMLSASAVPCVHMMELGNAEGVISVGFSQRDAGRAAAQHLLARGDAGWALSPHSWILVSCSGLKVFERCWPKRGCKRRSWNCWHHNPHPLAWAVSCSAS